MQKQHLIRDRQSAREYRWDTPTEIGWFIGHIEAEDAFAWDCVQPLVEEGGEQGRVRGRGDVDAVTRGESRADGFVGGGQVDDEIGRREQRWSSRANAVFARIETTHKFVEAEEEFEFGVGEPAAGVERGG